MRLLYFASLWNSSYLYDFYRNIRFHTSPLSYLLFCFTYVVPYLPSFGIYYLICHIIIYRFSGLDTAFNIVSGWQKEFPEEKSFVIPACLAAKVKRGEMGRKSGKGFYNWDGDKILGPV